MIRWRVAWHEGFGGTKTDETYDLPAFVRALRAKNVDWVEVFGAQIVQDSKSSELN